MIAGTLFLLLVYVLLIVPGFTFVKKSKLFKANPGAELCTGIVVGICLIVLMATGDYVFRLNPLLTRIITLTVIFAGIVEFVRLKYYREIWSLRFPMICWLAMALLAACIFSLPYHARYTKFPDPTFQSANHYNTLNVKILNLSRTQANDNYIPYRQAQFFVNRLDPAKTPFIAEWDVGFFERTPLMGAFTAGIYDLLGEKVPSNILWTPGASDSDHTYLQFQLIACLLNMVFVVPAFFLLSRIFSVRVAVLTDLFLVVSSYFLYNAIFSWPKSLVAFFVLLGWLLIYEKRARYTVAAGVVAGIAYLTHDLAFLYIGATTILLLLQRRIKDILIYILIVGLFALPWLYASVIYYKQPSSFIYYPISIAGIPQNNQHHQIVQAFLHTPIIKLATIRLQSFWYFFNPFNWSNSEFSVVGALGYGLIIPFFAGLIKKWKDPMLLILIFFPIVLEVLFIGWTDGLGALHFAEAIEVLSSGIAIYILSRMKGMVWLLLGFVVNALQMLTYIVYSYNNNLSGWFTSPGPLLRICFILGLTFVTGWLIVRYSKQQKIWVLA